MAYRNFRVGPNKGLLLAELQNVPNLLVIVGPNGAGKSTLLYELRQQAPVQAESGTQVLYLNPNRPWRRTDFNSAMLATLPYSLSQMYAMPQFPGFQNYQPPGFVNSGLARTPDNADDIQALVKFSIARLGDRRRRAIVDKYDQLGGSIPPNTLRDAFAPLKEMVTQLLPHLRFTGVAEESGQNIRCMFEKLDGDSSLTVEMDDLSSGEKAVFQLLLPFIETQVEAIIDGTDERNDVPPPPVLAIIDEPELHLHPALQVSLLAYLRTMAERSRAQFILATHSTSIMDACEEDELYLLAPPATVSGGNQLMKLSSTNERLDTVRELTGSTYAVTRCRPIVYVEGQRPTATKDATDQRLLEMLVPDSKGWVIVPAKGKAEVIRLADALRDPTLTELPGMPVFALVDKDTATDDEYEDHIITWPVCMIENLLLDAEAIWKVLEPHRETTGLSSQIEVQDALVRISHERVDAEVDLRIRRDLKPFKYYRMISGPEELESISAEVEGALSTYVEQFPSLEETNERRSLTEASIASVVANGLALEQFHGKEMLRAFFHQYAKRAGLSYVAFIYAVAATARDLERCQRLTSAAVRRINQFVPQGLVALMEDLPQTFNVSQLPDYQALLLDVQAAREKWSASEPDTTSRRQLRTRLSQLSRDLARLGANSEHSALLEQLPLLGEAQATTS